MELKHQQHLCSYEVNIQGHITIISCFVLDMQQQYDVILSDKWHKKAKAVLGYEYKFTFHPTLTMPCGRGVFSLPSFPLLVLLLLCFLIS